jgi:ribonuclease BN (tRNA processing enzyme)
VLGDGPDGFGPYHDAAVALCDDVDLLIHDAQYTANELEFRLDFGHSAVDYAVGLGRKCGVGKVLLFHHDPDRTDAEVAAIERAMRAAGDVAVEAAREGATIWLGNGSTSPTR